MKPLNRLLPAALLTAIFTSFTAVAVRADIPATISFQGEVTNTSGAPVTGSRSITFSLYTAQTGGTAIWTETKTVAISAGSFTTALGDVQPFAASSVAFNVPYFLGVKVGTDAEMTPREPLRAVPYALRASVQSGGGISGMKEFFTGSTFVVPSGVYSLQIEVFGGGGGAGSDSTGANGTYPGGVGGAGGYARTILPVSPSQTLNISIGNGGAPGATGGTTFVTIGSSSTRVIYATGGLPGSAATQSTYGVNGVAGTGDPNANIARGGQHNAFPFGSPGNSAGWAYYSGGTAFQPGAGGSTLSPGFYDNTAAGGESNAAYTGALSAGPGYVYIQW